MPISIQCDCGRKLNVSEQHRGKKAKCPDCGELLLVEEQSKKAVPTGVQAKAPTKRSRAAVGAGDDDDDDREDDSEFRRPLKRKKKKAVKRSMAPWILGGCGLLSVLACCLTGVGGAAVWYFYFRSESDLQYVHDGVAGFVTIRVADGWKSKLVQDQLNKLPAEMKRELDKKLNELQEKDERIEDLERVTVIIRSADLMNMDMAIVCKANRRIDPKKVLDGMVKEAGNAKYKEVNHEGLTLYVFDGQFQGAPGPAVCFPDSKVMLMSMSVGKSSEKLKDLLKKAKTPAKNAALVRGLSMASSGKHTMVAAFEVKKSLMDQAPPDAWKQAPNLKTMNGFIFAATTSSDLALEAIITFPDSAKAEKGKKDVDDLKGFANTALKNAKDVPPWVGNMMNSISIEQQGPDVVVKARTDVDLEPLFKMQGGFPIGGGPVGGGGADANVAVGQIMALDGACRQFQLINKRWPNNLNELTNGGKRGPPMVNPAQLIDPRGQAYQFDRNGPRNNGQRPDIWTVIDGKMIGNWPAGNK